MTCPHCHDTGLRAVYYRLGGGTASALEGPTTYVGADDRPNYRAQVACDCARGADRCRAHRPCTHTYRRHVEALRTKKEAA